jgi:hypothetical protein
MLAIDEAVARPKTTAASKSHQTDPIFAAIERHRRLYLKQMASGQIAFHLHVGTPVHEAAAAKHKREDDACDSAAIALTTIQPTTLAGVLALMDYAAAFNTGRLFLPNDPEEWRSWPGDWPGDRHPALNDETVLRAIDSDEPFAWFLMRNIRNALADLQDATVR